jgi:hypothetical protein
MEFRIRAIENVIFDDVATSSDKKRNMCQEESLKFLNF